MPERVDVEAIYRVHGPAVFRRACRILGSESEASEMVQNVFLSLFERPEQFRGHSKLTTFLYSMTTHACLNHLRNQRNRQRLLDEWQRLEVESGDAFGFRSEQRVMLQQALAAMPSELSQAAVYYLVDGFTHAEIARLLDCSRRHVGDLLARLEQFDAPEREAAC